MTPAPHFAGAAVPAELRVALAKLQQRLDLPTSFTAQVLAEAEEASGWPLPDYVDRTDVQFVTIDPEGSRDLDQAVQIERADDGYLVRYAISDVAYFVRPGTALEAETHSRGQTKYAPGARIALHPPVLSEGAASLLADGVPRPVLLWEILLGATGVVVKVSLSRALVRSSAKLSYEQVQADLQAGTPHPSIALLPQVGRLREALEIARGGVSLNLPEQEIVEHEGTWGLELRSLVCVENWNAQISLLTGFVAADVMLNGKVGIVRTLPPAEPQSIERLRRASLALGVAWPPELSYPDFVRSLSPEVPAELAVLTKCTMLFRGAGYLRFDGELPADNVVHGALCAPYAHATAPLRRLVDRYVLEICYCLLNDLSIPDWALAGLARLPEEMAASNRSANAYQRGVIDLAEALVMSTRVGERFSGVVTEVNPKTGSARVQIADPAVELRVTASPAEAGREIQVRIEHVDVLEGIVEASRA